MQGTLRPDIADSTLVTLASRIADLHGLLASKGGAIQYSPHHRIHLQIRMYLLHPLLYCLARETHVLVGDTTPVGNLQLTIDEIEQPRRETDTHREVDIRILVDRIGVRDGNVQQD
ncbi:hypothetical protein [Streptomyces sp. NPDC088350]|uniref:hypothetical protein n=1 Tax=Streptomyces sp. NPDC088350 TaxID=3365854 RepID=UPI00381323D6